MSIDKEHFRRVFWEILKSYSINEKSVLVDNDNDSGTGGDVIDLLNNNRDNVINLKLMSRERFYVKKVMEALDRIDAGVFGICDECGDEIDFKRLKARPTANLCTVCKEAQEREEEHVVYHRKSHTLGQAINNDNIINLPINSDEIPKESEYILNRDMENFRQS